MEIPEPTHEHLWLKQFLGEWTMTSDADCGPNGESIRNEGKETVTALGDFWVIGEGEMSMPGGGTGYNRITLGFDPMKQKFVGSWVGSMMSMMWPYEGELDESGKVLTLNSEGPTFDNPDKIGNYRDVFEIVDEGHRVLTSHTQQPDGRWKQFMRAEYRRIK